MFYARIIYIPVCPQVNCMLCSVTKGRLLDWMAQIPPRICGIQRALPDSQTLKCEDPRSPQRETT